MRFCTAIVEPAPATPCGALLAGAGTNAEPAMSVDEDAAIVEVNVLVVHGSVSKRTKRAYKAVVQERRLV